MKARFLLDENMSPHFAATLRAYLADIDVIRVGDSDAPPLRTPDETILLYLDEAGRMLITKNRASMPEHLRTHFARGGKHWGILTIREGARLRDIIESLSIIEGAAEDWINTVMWIPF